MLPPGENPLRRSNQGLQHRGALQPLGPRRGQSGAGGAPRATEGPPGKASAAGDCRAGGRRGPGNPAGFSGEPRLASIASRGRRCQTPPGGRGSRQPRPLLGEPARPHHASAGSESTKRGQGSRGESGGPAAPQQLCQRQSSPPATRRPERGPSRPARPRTCSGFRGSLFAGMLPPFPVLVR